ncbi:hypothetical protein WN944_000741 [Citrus x changshan-huyou]|uniref:Uncharacterized protein n=1 Tax=Citrus x changshan-huyou TaxID=2935761 RepID=A0AAP0MDF3_9ROSI
MNKTSLDGDRRLPTSEYRRRRGSATGIGAAKRSVYMDIEAVVGGDLLTVASVIPKQYNLKKLWADIRDLCFDQSIKHATKVRFQVMLPWETNELKKDRGNSALLKDRNYEDESPDAQFNVLLAPEPDVEWVGFPEEKKLTLSDLNNESNTVDFAAATLTMQDSYESMAAVRLNDNTHVEEFEPEKKYR